MDLHAPPLYGSDEARRRDETDPGAVPDSTTTSIWNGWELGSGSIRSTTSRVQERVFRTMGCPMTRQRGKFGFLLDALAMGAPPHGGFAMGIERFVALLAGEPDIRQVIAFPKVSSGSDPLTGARRRCRMPFWPRAASRRFRRKIQVAREFRPIDEAYLETRSR